MEGHEQKRGVAGRRMTHLQGMEETFAPAVAMEGATKVVAPGQPPGTERLGDLYKTERHLGAGGFGSVFSAVKLSDGSRVVIKYVSIKKIFHWAQGPSGEVIPEEAYLMYRVNHVDGVVKLLDVFSGSDYFALILEELEEPVVDLFEYMNTAGCLTEDMAGDMVRQLVRIATDLSRARVFHRDIKDENLLLQPRTGKLHLIDFGSGEDWKSTEYYTFSGTHMCKPREFVVKGCYRAEPATVWSIGVLTYRLIMGVCPYNDDDEILLNRLNFKLPHRLISTEFVSFVTKCLESTPCYRPTLAELATHSWLNPDAPRTVCVPVASECGMKRTRRFYVAPVVELSLETVQISLAVLNHFPPPYASDEADTTSSGSSECTVRITSTGCEDLRHEACPVPRSHGNGSLKRSPHLPILREEPVKIHLGHRIIGSLRRWYDQSVFAPTRPKPVFFFGNDEPPCPRKKSFWLIDAIRSANRDSAAPEKKPDIPGDLPGDTSNYSRLKSQAPPAAAAKSQAPPPVLGGSEKKPKVSLGDLASRIAEAMRRLKRNIMNKCTPPPPVVIDMEVVNNVDGGSGYRS